MIGPWLTADDKAAVQRVLDSGDLMSGKLVAEFEAALAAHFDRRHCVCVSSGTAALEAAFAATGEGGRIHSHGFIAILSAARAAGRDPVRDDDNGTCTDVLGLRYPENTRVHDCSHHYEMRGDLSCISFNQNKIIACCGGAVLTDDGVAAAFMRQYRNHGREGPRVYGAGRHLRMGEINAALGLSQLKRIDEILARRKQVAHWYDEITGRDLADTRESWFLYPVHKPGHKQRSLADFRLFNTATQEDRDTALLPIWPMMTREDCEEVCYG